MTSLGMVSYPSKRERNVHTIKQTATYSQQARHAEALPRMPSTCSCREQVDYTQQQLGIAQAQLEE